MRHAYLASVLQQEVAYFDVEASSGKLLHGLNEDIVTVQEAIGEKVGNFVHHLFTFLVGVAIGQCTCCAQSIVAAVLAAFSLYLSQACAAPEPPVLCTK